MSIGWTFFLLSIKCIYNKGSLKQTCLNLAVTDSNNVKPLPPVRKSALTPQDREHFKLLIPNEDEVDIDILIIFQKCASIDVDGFLLGSKSGRHKSTSIVFICHHSSEDLKLGIIHYFAKVAYLSSTENTTEPSTAWFAYVTFFLPHECKVWYGYPTEVWSISESSSSYFIPLSNIKSGAAYIQANVNFGCSIGIQPVFVAVPI